MKEMEFKIPQMRNYRASACYNNKLSMTLPNDCYSPAEILSRFVMGKSLPRLSEDYFEDDLPNLSTMDFTERDELKREVKQTINNLKENIYVDNVEKIGSSLTTNSLE